MTDMAKQQTTLTLRPPEHRIERRVIWWWAIQAVLLSVPLLVGAMVAHLLWGSEHGWFIAAVLSVLVVEDTIGAAWLWAPAVFWPLALGGALVAYRALGHTITGRYVVLRSGLMNRSTDALQRDAVSTIVIRESLFQRRLGLQTVSAMSAAGYGSYAALDMAAEQSLTFATQAAPGIFDEFVEATSDGAQSSVSA